MAQKLPDSRHFHLHELADRVWAAIHRPGGWAIANAGIVDLGEETLVFDTFMTPAAAQDLRAAAKTLTGRRATKVVLSHYHNDHIWGAQVFDEAALISTHLTKHLIETKGREEYEYYREEAPVQARRLEKRLSAGAGEAEKQVIAMLFPYYNAMVKSFPVLEIQQPDLTFADRVVIHGTTRTAEIVTYGGGHTGSDAILLLPEDSIAFLSDLLFVDSIPYLADGDPWETLRILDRVAELEAPTLVPGHGPVGGAEHLDQMKDYIRMVERSTAEAVTAGEAVDQVLGRPLPEPFAAWEFAPFHRSNVHFFYEHYSKHT